MESVARSVSNNTKQLVEVNAKLQEQLNQGGGGGGDATAANQTLQLAQETIIAGDTTSIDAKITTGNAETYNTTLQSNLIYGRQFDGTLRASKINTVGSLFVANPDITSGSDATLTEAQQVLVYGRDSSGGVDALKVDNQGHLEVVQDAEQQVSTIFSGTQVIAGTAVHLFTTPLDKNGSTKFNLLISSSTTPADIEYSVEVGVSDDGVDFYADANGIGAPSVSQIQNAQLSIIDQTSRYARFTILNNSLVDLTITSIKATRISGI
jgi:hypothetical protein